MKRRKLITITLLVVLFYTFGFICGTNSKKPEINNLKEQNAELMLLKLEVNTLRDKLNAVLNTMIETLEE